MIVQKFFRTTTNSILAEEFPKGLLSIPGRDLLKLE